MGTATHAKKKDVRATRKYAHKHVHTHREAKAHREKEVDELVRERLVKPPETDFSSLLKALGGQRGVGGPRAR
jgi:hypothetical protein